MIHVGTLAFTAPNQELDRSFCCWTTGLAQKKCFLFRHGWLRADGLRAPEFRIPFGDHPLKDWNDTEKVSMAPAQG